MSVLWTLAATIALRADASALTLEQAKAMSPAELADALLAQGYPAIIDARIGVQGIGPPPPPATLVQSPIELIAAARVSGEPGFCERTVIKILLAPVINENGRTPAAPPRNFGDSADLPLEGQVRAECRMW